MRYLHASLVRSTIANGEPTPSLTLNSKSRHSEIRVIFLPVSIHPKAQQGINLSVATYFETSNTLHNTDRSLE